jgi:hypothetical protein
MDKKFSSTDHVEDKDAFQRSDSSSPNHELSGEIRPRRTTEEKQAMLKIAQAEDPGLHWSSMRSMQFWGMVLVICCCGGDTGLDATSESTVLPEAISTKGSRKISISKAMSSINGMKQYQNYFGMGKAATKTCRSMFYRYSVFAKAYTLHV